ncbi:DNA-processing protein DprA [Pseudonocardia adelaidensis]|uniref:DNA-processing protein DprA n=1 Tax=Pseudonocardia adelaidensis TaxID=648754 RepID=UPI0031E9D64F
MAEPPAPGVAALAARLGPVEAAERIRSGRVSDRVAAETHDRHRVWRAEADLAAAAAVGARLVTPGHAEWPTGLFDACTTTGDAGTTTWAPALAPPVALWVRGPARLTECCERAVAVIGSRAATNYGTHLASDLGAGLARGGKSVVAAASQGIDAAALKGVLAVAGISLAMRPSGIDQPVPRPLAPLLEAVTATGLVVSEYPPGVAPSRTRLIARSRLLAALSRATVVSRLPLQEVREVSAFPDGLRPIQVDDTAPEVSTVGRAVLIGQVQAGGHTVSLVTCHLKSKLLTFPGGRFSTSDDAERARFAAFALYRRAAEAVTVRQAATELLAGNGQHRAVIVLGDLNDEPEAATTQILHGPPGSEIGTGGYSQPDRGDGQRLWNLAARIPQPQRYTRIYRGRPELIDHILASHQVTQAVADGDVTAGPAPASIEDNPNVRRDAPGSDHRPVVATINLP